MALLTRSQLRAPVSLGSAPPHLRPVRRVLARAEPPSGAKVTREYREDTGEVTGPSASQRADGLYVDDSAPRPVPKQGNLSKEMKARLRKEYTGLGGAENKAMSSNLFLNIIIFVAFLAVASKLTGAI